MAVMMVLEVFRSLGWIKYLLRGFRPIVRVMGLSQRSAMLWAIAIIFGVMFGGAVIIEEVKKGALTKEELERLHISIGVNHSIIEDPALFIALGLPGFWMVFHRCPRGSGVSWDKIH
jgi:spore maturation protein SpmB